MYIVAWSAKGTDEFEVHCVTITSAIFYAVGQLGFYTSEHCPSGQCR